MHVSANTSFKERLPVLVEEISHIVVKRGLLSDEEFYEILKKKNVPCDFLEVRAVAGLLLGVPEGTGSTTRH